MRFICGIGSTGLPFLTAPFHLWFLEALDSAEEHQVAYPRGRYQKTAVTKGSTSGYTGTSDLMQV